MGASVAVKCSIAFSFRGEGVGQQGNAGSDRAVDGVEHLDGGEADGDVGLGLVGSGELDRVGGAVDGVRLDAVEAEGAHLLGVAVGGAEDDVSGGGDEDVGDLDGADGLGAVGLHVGDGDGVVGVEGGDEAGEGLGAGLVRRVPHRVPLVRFLVSTEYAYSVLTSTELAH
jgi:hypothetical protein